MELFLVGEQRHEGDEGSIQPIEPFDANLTDWFNQPAFTRE
jgi:hypothetical protein